MSISVSDDIITFDVDAILTFTHSTINATRQWLRETFRNAIQRDALAIGAFLNTLTNNQLKVLFTLSDTQTTILRGKLSDMASLLIQLKTQAGQ